MPTTTDFDYAVILIVEDGTLIRLWSDPDLAKIESDAFYYLGLQTTRGTVIASRVVDSNGKVIGEFV